MIGGMTSNTEGKIWGKKIVRGGGVPESLLLHSFFRSLQCNGQRGEINKRRGKVGEGGKERLGWGGGNGFKGAPGRGQWTRKGR